jgi:hypothetical protein
METQGIESDPTLVILEDIFHRASLESELTHDRSYPLSVYRRSFSTHCG